MRARLDAKLVLVAASVIGLVASLPVLLEWLGGEASVCTSDCSALYDSPYARIGPVHFSAVAAPYFIVLFLVALAYWRGAEKSRVAALALGALGVVLIPYLVYVEVFLVGVICIYCTIMHVCIIAYSLAAATAR